MRPPSPNAVLCSTSSVDDACPVQDGVGSVSFHHRARNGARWQMCEVFTAGLPPVTFSDLGQLWVTETVETKPWMREKLL